MNDVCDTNRDWLYSETVKDHFFNPRNFLLPEENFDADGVFSVGSAACGDIITVYIKIYIDELGVERISKCKWRTFGCASAIAAASMMSQIATENGGMNLKRASKLKPQEIIERLGGLPERKFHCSVLGHEALRGAVLNYLNKK
jgi:NifU-like protein